MQKKLELALDTYKDKNETWEQVFDRVGTERGIDPKVIIKVLLVLIEQLEK